MPTGGKSAGNFEAELKRTFRINQLSATSSPLPGTEFKYLQYILNLIFLAFRTPDLHCQRTRLYALFLITGCSCMSATLEVVAAGSRANQIGSASNYRRPLLAAADRLFSRYQTFVRVGHFCSGAA